MKKPEQQDEFHGIGGSYVIDPDTGMRRPAGGIPAEVQADAAAAAPDAQAPGKPAKPVAATQPNKPGEK